MNRYREREREREREYSERETERRRGRDVYTIIVSEPVTFRSRKVLHVSLKNYKQKTAPAASG